MQWFRERPPAPVRTIAIGVVLVAAYFLAYFALLRLWGVAGGFVVGGVVIAGVIAWELVIEGPRRKRQRQAIMQTRQEAPGTQSLRTEPGARHWTQRLPDPVTTAVSSAPISVVTVAVVVATLVVGGILGGTAPAPPDGRAHASLAIGSWAEIRPTFDGEDGLKVTILGIDEAAEEDIVGRSPIAGWTFWSIEAAVENTGSREIEAPSWVLVDTDWNVYDLVAVQGGPLPFPLAPGHATTQLVVFEVGPTFQPRHLRFIPDRQEKTLRPNAISFDAD